MANNKCRECGCECKKCVSDHDVHLHVEIENLKQRLVERDNHIVTMETNFLNEANKFPNGEVVALREELLTWQDKYKRLYEAHRRVQRVNQGLEDKLLKLVDVCETDKNTLTKDVASLSHKLADAKYTIKKLTEDNERYKSDLALAIQLLQCKQSNFVPQKIDSLPAEVQTQVSSYLTNKKKPEEKKITAEVKSIKVPIPTFPPTAMVYSVPKSPSTGNVENENENQPVDIVSAAIMAKVLEERERERSMIKHCDTCTCSKKNIKIINHDTHHSIGVQTIETFHKSLENGNTLMKALNEKTNIENKSANALSDNSTSSSLINLSSISSPKTDKKIFHHRLCDKSSQCFDCDTDNEKTSAKDVSSSLKGPRYCSMRVQSGSKNILLDNAHSNIAPVLYTRQKMKNMARTHESANSCSSDECKPIEGAVNNEQRTADWVENSDDFEVSSSENSKSETTKNDVDKLAQMEDNVKKFLFGKSEFLKTVEIGKMKYQSMREKDVCVNNQSYRTSRSNSHTETEI